MDKIIGKKIIRYQEIASTNDKARQLIKQGEGEGLVVVALAQSKGRGKPGSAWVSPAGKGLYLSAVVRPYKNPKDLAPITLLGANAAIAAINKAGGLVGLIKEPNDVLVNGKKICGVLVERVASGEVIIGIGVNVNNEPADFPLELQNKATSMKIEAGKSFDLDNFSQIVIQQLDKAYLAYLSKI
ncbi:MAG: biotin--[acetyl-CoA-carboxylase] ligase [Candidatus Margulisbacteria bacterium]|nr:biotin--[acetyl-CoA-carboxylase] ligase [Candidatus Margulisiibacteriota bacterium]